MALVGEAPLSPWSTVIITRVEGITAAGGRIPYPLPVATGCLQPAGGSFLPSAGAVATQFDSLIYASPVYSRSDG